LCAAFISPDLLNCLFAGLMPNFIDILSFSFCFFLQQKI
jgi:hypothetical protein